MPNTNHVCLYCPKLKDCDWKPLEDCKRKKIDLILVEYQEGSETLRVMPMNYMVASFNKGSWVVDPDGAIPIDTATQFFKFFMRHENKFRKDSWKEFKIQ